jgi:selenoprotein W-related protein
LAAVLRDIPGSEVELVPGTGGVFEVSVEGENVFSKKKEGRFPSHDEILAQVEAR